MAVGIAPPAVTTTPGIARPEPALSGLEAWRRYLHRRHGPEGPARLGARTSLEDLCENDPDGHLRDRQLTPFVVRARRVILAAGTLGSTEILSRSDDLTLSDRLKHGFSANGDMLVIAHDLKQPISAVADERKNPVREESKGAEDGGIGPTITSMIDLRQGDPKTDLVIKDLAVPGALRRLYEETTTTFDVIDRSADGDWNCHKPNPGRVDDAAVDPGAIDNSLVMAMIGRDDAEGVMRMNPAARDNADGLLTVDWRDLKLDPRLDTHHKRLVDLLSSSGLGGKIMNNLLWRPLSDRLEKIFGRQRGPLLTVHPLGGCSMGHDVLQGVTDHCGRVFNASKRNKANPLYDGLVVLDGSIVPTSLGINPALTIAALALRALCELKLCWELEGWASCRRLRQKKVASCRRLRQKKRSGQML